MSTYRRVKIDKDYIPNLLALYADRNFSLTPENAVAIAEIKNIVARRHGFKDWTTAVYLTNELKLCSMFDEIIILVVMAANPTTENVEAPIPPQATSLIAFIKWMDLQGYRWIETPKGFYRWVAEGGRIMNGADAWDKYLQTTTKKSQL